MWKYKNKDITEEEIPDKAIGFIYIIECLKNNKKYIGRKLLTKAAYKQVNGKKKKIRKQSDWLTYYSSCPALLADIELFGKEYFKRTIILFCDSKAVLTYAEEKLQYSLGVLESDMWYNANIRSRVFKKHIYGKVDFTYVNDFLSLLTTKPAKAGIEVKQERTHEYY